MKLIVQSFSRVKLLILFVTLPISKLPKRCLLVQNGLSNFQEIVCEFTQKNLSLCLNCSVRAMQFTAKIDQYSEVAVAVTSNIRLGLQVKHCSLLFNEKRFQNIGRRLNFLVPGRSRRSTPTRSSSKEREASRKTRRCRRASRSGTWSGRRRRRGSRRHRKRKKVLKDILNVTVNRSLNQIDPSRCLGYKTLFFFFTITPRHKARLRVHFSA